MQNLYNIEDPNPIATALMDSGNILEEILIEDINKVRDSLPESLTILERIEALKRYNTYGTISNVEIHRIRRNQRISKHKGVKSLYHYHAILPDYSYLTWKEIQQWNIHTDFNQRILQIRHFLRTSTKTRFKERRGIIFTNMHRELCLSNKYALENKHIRKFWAIIAEELYRQYLKSYK